MRAVKAVSYLLGASALGAVTIVAQDAMVVGGSALPPGAGTPMPAAPNPAPQAAPSPARSPFAPAEVPSPLPSPAVPASVVPGSTVPASAVATASPFAPAASAPSLSPSSSLFPSQPAPAVPAPASAPASAVALAPAPAVALAPAPASFHSVPVQSAPVQSAPVQSAPIQSSRAPIPAESRGYYPGREDKGLGYTPDYSPSPTTGSHADGMRGRAQHYAPDYAPGQYAQVSGGSTLPPGAGNPVGNPVGSPAGGSTVPPTSRPAPRRQSWAQKLGLGNISTRLFGHAKVGAGARDETRAGEGFGEDGGGSWEETLIADAHLGAEASAITRGGLEYGARVELRGAYDNDPTLLGGQVGSCPVGAACAGQVAGQVNVAGTDFALRGHTSQLFTGLRGFDSGFEDDARIVLDGAHIFLRTGYGDVTLGRDVGAGKLFSLGAPNLLALGGNNGRADYTSLSLVTTENDPTAYAEKITYTTPKLGGDRIGVGIQFGASYTPDVDACGVYTCLRRNGSDKAAGSLGATLEDAIELGLAIDRTLSNFAGGDLKAEVTATYATASNQADAVAESLAAFDDLQSWNVGAQVEWRDFTFGGSYLSSNNALIDGDYTAWDAGLTWRASSGALDGWGVTLGYASAEDDNVQASSDEYILGLSRELRDGLSVGAGLQYIEREVPALLLDGTAGRAGEDATALFLETGFTF